MTKSELIQKMALEAPHLTVREIEKVVNAIFEAIMAALSQDNRVELRGFGAFSLRKRQARDGRNPKTGDSVHVDAKNMPYFKPGKLLRQRLNENIEVPEKRVASARG